MTAPVRAANVSNAETRDRLRRGRSLPCPKCQAQAGGTCRAPDGTPATTHAARWDAWYAAHPEAVEPPRAETDCACGIGGLDCPCDADGSDGLCACCRTGEHRGSCADPGGAS